MKYVRKMQNINPKNGRFLTVSIPWQFTKLFADTDMAIIEGLPGCKGIVVMPAKITPIE